MVEVNTTKSEIYLITGFMASGKSYSGRKLASELSYRFVDLDDVVEASAKKTIPEIFSEQGEESFRQYETDCFEKLVVQNSECLIIAAGGGFPTIARNQIAMKKVTVIFLDTDFEEICKRLNTSEINKRPLLQNSLQGIKKLYENRYRIYTKTADFIVHNYKELFILMNRLKGNKNE